MTKVTAVQRDISGLQYSRQRATVNGEFLALFAATPLQKGIWELVLSSTTLDSTLLPTIPLQLVEPKFLACS
jgi:hypothetical protein